MMDLKTRLEVLPCGKCEDMMDCDLCIFQKEAKELYQQIRADAIDEVKKLIRNNRRYFLTNGIAELFIDTELEQLKEHKNG